jgi:hypothetical protein
LTGGVLTLLSIVAATAIAGLTDSLEWTIAKLFERLTCVDYYLDSTAGSLTVETRLHQISLQLFFENLEWLTPRSVLEVQKMAQSCS